MKPVTDPALLAELDGDGGRLVIGVDGTDVDEERRQQEAAGPTPVQDPALLEQLNATDEDAPARPTRHSLEADPDKTARARVVAQATGLPVLVVERNLEAVEKKYRLDQIDEIAQRNPALAKALSNPDNAKVMHDDVENLSTVERLGGAFKRGVAGLSQGGSAVAARSNQNVLQNMDDVERRMALGETIPDAEDLLGTRFMSAEQRAALRRDLRKSVGESVANIVEREADKKATVQALPSVQAAMQAKEFGAFWDEFLKAPFEFIGTVTAESLPNMAPGIVAAIPGGIIGGPAGAAAAMGAGSFSVDYASSIMSALTESGVDPKDPAALEAALADPALMAEIGRKAFAHASVVGTLDAASGGAATVRMAAGRAANAAAQLGAQGALGGLGEAGGAIAAGDELHAGSIMAEILGETVTAPIEVATVAGASVMEANKQRAKAERAAEHAKRVAELNANVERTLSRVRDPEAFKAFMADATTDENGDAAEFFIEGRAFAQSLAETGVNVDEFKAKSPELYEQLVEAVQTGGDVRVPVADFATAFAGTPTGEALVQHVRSSEDAMSAAEAAIFAQSDQAAFEQAMAADATAAAEAAVEGAVEQTVQTTISDQIKATGRYSDEVSAINTSVATAMFKTIAARMGITVDEAYQQFPLKIVDRTGAQPTETLTATDDPQFGAWFGESKAVDESGAPLTLYTGTSKDTDFTAFKVPRNGTWFTTDPSEASTYSVENDSQGTVYKDGKFTSTNTASRVLPVHLSVQNPMVWDAMPESLRLAENYKRAQGIEFDKLRAQGYDSVILRGGQGRPDTYVILGSPTQIKSVFNRGTWDGDSKNMLNQKARPRGRPVPATVDATTNVEAARAFAATRRFTTNRDFKLALQERALRAAKDARVDLSDFSPHTEDYLVRVAISDALAGLSGTNNAVGWYNEKTTKALRIVSLIHPEIATSPEAKFAFVWALAVTSNGMEVNKNFELAESAYRALKKNGVMPTNIGAGQAQAAINDKLALYNTMLADMGFEALQRFMTTQATVKEINEIAAKYDSKVGGENLSTRVYGSAILGPKIGNGFFSNLYGHFEQLTIDRWLMRTWGRWSGTLITDNRAQARRKREQLGDLVRALSPADKKSLEAIVGSKLKLGDLDAVATAIVKASQKPDNRAAMAKIGLLTDEQSSAILDPILGAPVKGSSRYGLGDEIRKAGNSLGKYNDGQKEAPKGPPERAQMRTVLGRALVELQREMPALTMADLQAVLWYPEKLLYDAAKVADDATTEEGYSNDEAPDYANAAARIARANGVDEGRIAAAVAAVDAEIAAALGAAGARSAAGGTEAGAGTGATQTQFTADLADPDAEPIVLNVGLDTNDGGKLTEQEAIAAIEAIGVPVISSNRYSSDTEPTLVAQVARELTEEEVDALSVTLRQDAIAQMVGDRGTLFGPKKEAWGPFNPEFFIKLDGTRASEGGVLAQGASVPQPLVGVHFSNGVRTTLDGRYHGRGMKGNEAARLADPDVDRRLRERIYVYIDQGAGVQPEDGVGGVAHEVVLPRLYDWDGDPQGLRRPNDPNGNEVRVLDAGYDGYFVRRFGNSQGAAVILGNATRGIEARAIPTPASPMPVVKAPTRYTTALMSKEIKAVDEGVLQAAAPSAKIRTGTLSVDFNELDAARAVLAKMGVSLPEQSLNQDVMLDELAVAFGDLLSIENNASGESAASLEAQSRLASEKASGRVRVRVDRYGNVTPVIGVDGVDARARAGEAILQRGIGAQEWTVLDGATTEGERARAISHVRRAFDTLAQRSAQPRGTFNPSTNTIAILEQANLSTFLHELGHFGLEMMVEIATRPGAPQTVVDDVRIILDWFGIKDIQTWNAMSLDEKRPHHEQFAEGFETYLFEGKAPSDALSGPFARIRVWMQDVYRRLSNQMRVQLTDEVRGVFDRMLASDEQIAEQARVRDMAPLFASAEAAGMTAEQWTEYQDVGSEAARTAVDELRSRTLKDMKWLTNAQGRALKKLQASAKEVRGKVRAEVAESVDAQPVYAALRFIEHGVAADRDLTNAQRKAIDTVAGGKTKLSLPVLKEMYGDHSPILGHIKQTLVAAEGGAHPDAVATAFGFDSGDALVRAILAAEPRHSLIEALTDRRMLEEHSDLSDPDAMQRAAEAAIHSDARVRFVATEYKALQDGLNAREKVGETTVMKGKQRGQKRSLTVNALVRAANQYAEAIVGRTVIRKLSPNTHARTAGNESKAARAAAAKGDMARALTHKRNQLLHEKTARAMEEARTEFERHLAYLKKFRNNRARGAISSEYAEQIDNLLTAIDTRNATNRRLESLASLRKWVAQQEAEGLPIPLDAEMIESLQVTNVRDLTVDGMRGLVDQVKMIEHLGKLKKKLLTARDQREFDAIMDSLSESIRDNGGKARDVPFAPSAAEHATGRRFRAFLAEHRKLASFARQMDGGVDDGPMWRALIRGMNDAGNRETSLIAGSTKALTDIFKPLEKLKGGLTGDKRLIPSLGKSLSREERIAVVLNWGNEDNRQRVLNTVPQAGVNEIMATMTRAELTAVQAIWDHINGYWPDIAAKQKRVTGVAPEKVEAAPFTVAAADGGTVDMAGGYYPIVYESELSDVAAAHEQAQIAKDMLAGAYTRQTTRRGHTKKRAEKVSEPVQFTLNVIERHIAQVVHDLSWHEWLIDANRTMRDSRVTGAVRAHYGNEVLAAIKNALNDIATGDLHRQTTVAKIVGGFRARGSATMMGWSMTTALLQPFGLFQSIPRVGAKWIAVGLKHWAGDMVRFENSARLIREKSEMMRSRSTTFNRDIREVTARVHRGKGVAAQVFDASVFVLMQKMQLIADVPTWWGAYEKALSQSPDEGRAVALADQAVLDAQGGGTVKDLAGVQRGGELMRSLSMFYSYFSATHQIVAERTSQTNFRKPGQVAGWLADMALLSVVPVLAQNVIYALIRGGPDDDEDKDFWDEAADLGIETAAFWLNTFIGLREISGLVQGFDYNGPAVTRAIVETGNLGKSAKKAIDPDEELDDDDYRRALKSVLTILGLPAIQIDRSWRGWKAWANDEAGPGAILLGPPPVDR